MIREEKTYIVACNCCGRDAEDISKTSEPIAWRTREQAIEDWENLDCGPAAAPSGKALCWMCCAEDVEECAECGDPIAGPARRNRCTPNHKPQEKP